MPGLDTVDDERQMVALYLSVLSCFGGCFVVISYLALSNLRHFAMKMVVLLSIFDLFLQGVRILKASLAPIPGTKLCTGLILVEHSAVLSPLVWAACISFALLYTLRKNRPNRVIKPQFPYYIMLSIGFPLLISLFTELVGYHEGEDDQCVMKHGSQTVVAIYSIAAPFVLFNFISIGVVTWREQGESSWQYMTFRFKIYPIAIATLWTIDIVAGILVLIVGSPRWAYTIGMFSSRFEGLTVALIYGCDSLILSELRISATQLFSPRGKSYTQNTGGDTIYNTTVDTSESLDGSPALVLSSFIPHAGELEMAQPAGEPYSERLQEIPMDPSDYDDSEFVPFSPTQRVDHERQRSEDVAIDSQLVPPSHLLVHSTQTGRPDCVASAIGVTDITQQDEAGSKNSLAVSREWR